MPDPHRRHAHDFTAAALDAFDRRLRRLRGLGVRVVLCLGEPRLRIVAERAGRRHVVVGDDPPAMASHLLQAFAHDPPAASQVPAPD